MRKIKYLTLFALATNCFIISDVRGEIQNQDPANESVLTADTKASSPTPAKKRGMLSGFRSKLSNIKSSAARQMHNLRGHSLIGRVMPGQDAAFHRETNILLRIKDDGKSQALYEKTRAIYNQKVDPRNQSRNKLGKKQEFKYCPIPEGLPLSQFVAHKNNYINRDPGAGPCEVYPTPSNPYPNPQDNSSASTNPIPNAPNAPPLSNAKRGFNSAARLKSMNEIDPNNPTAHLNKASPQQKAKLNEMEAARRRILNKEYIHKDQVNEDEFLNSYIGDQGGRKSSTLVKKNTSPTTQAKRYSLKVNKPNPQVIQQGGAESPSAA